MDFGSAFVRHVAWDSAQLPVTLDARAWRVDPDGHLISWDQYGNRDSELGLELDRVEPGRVRGDDAPFDRHAVCWRCNVARPDLRSSSPSFSDAFDACARRTSEATGRN